MRVRPPAVAGSFYPADAARLRAMVDSFLDRAADQPVPKAVIVPHAGYVYSGAVAGAGYATLAGAAGLRHVVLLGPCHYVGHRGLALPEADAMATPLGPVALWPEGVERALGLPGVSRDAAVHAREHSLEVQLPFLQGCLPEVDIVPLAVGWVSPEQVGAVIAALWGDATTAIVVSSDLSHYHPYDQARRLDQASVDQILALNGPLDHDQACGAGAINGLLAVAPSRRLTPHLIAQANSGDTAGDKDRVVGYAAIGFMEPADVAG